MRAIIIVEGLLCTDAVLRAYYRYSQSFNNLINWNFFPSVLLMKQLRLRVAQGHTVHK